MCTLFCFFLLLLYILKIKLCSSWPCYPETSWPKAFWILEFSRFRVFLFGGTIFFQNRFMKYAIFYMISLQNSQFISAVLFHDRLIWFAKWSFDEILDFPFLSNHFSVTNWRIWSKVNNWQNNYMPISSITLFHNTQFFLHRRLIALCRQHWFHSWHT